MKVNEWINKKFQESIFTRLTPSIEHTVRMRVQHKRCLTAKLCQQYLWQSTQCSLYLHLL